MKQNKYKSFQNTITLWCLTKWNDADITCEKNSTLSSADIGLTVKEDKIGFIFSFDKSDAFLKEQILNCQKRYTKLYLVTDCPDLTNTYIRNSIADGFRVLNIADPYNLGYIIQEFNEFNI